MPVYNKGKYLMISGTNFDTADLRCLLLNASGSFNTDHNFVSDISANEVGGAGYARQTLANTSITEDDTNDFAYVDADDAVFTVATGQTVGSAVVYVYNAADSAAALVGFYDVTDTPGNGGTITIQWATPANGGVLKVA